MTVNNMERNGAIADLIIAGVPVYGAPGAPAGSDAVAIAGDKIIGVGRADVLQAMCGPATRVIRPRRGCLIPGLVDSHAHLDREGLKSIWPSLDGARNKKAVLERIASIARRTPPGEWIVTMPLGGAPSYAGIDDFLVDGLPDRWDLDEVAPDNPVYIRSIWGYWRPKPPLVSIANSRALELAGIDRNTGSPSPQVAILRDERRDEPSGIFLEDTTMPIIELTLMACAPHFTPEQRVAALARSMAVYNRFGTTGVFEGHGAAPELIEAYRKLGAGCGHSVRARLTVSPSWSSSDPAAARQLVADWANSLRRRGSASHLMTLDGLYAEIDEKRENWVRATAAPQTGWAGFLYDCGLPRDDLKDVLVEAARNRLQVSCIFASIPPLYEEVHKIAPIDGLRWAWGHIGVVVQEEIERARDLGLVVVTHTNRHIAKQGSVHRARLGAEKEDTIVPLRRFLDAGVPVSLGSDNVPPSLWHPVSHAVMRRDGFTGETIAPSQKLTREEALHCATWNGAYLCGGENEFGSIEVGKLADIVVLDRDYMAVAEEEIAQISADTVISDGRLVLTPGDGGDGTGHDSRPTYV